MLFLASLPPQGGLTDVKAQNSKLPYPKRKLGSKNPPLRSSGRRKLDDQIIADYNVSISHGGGS